MPCYRPSENVRAGLFWVFSLLSLVIMIASVISNDSTPWATIKYDTGKSYFGLWKLYGCVDTTCVSISYSTYNTDVYVTCREFGIGAGIMLIVAIVFSSMLFILKFAATCCRDASGNFRKSLKVFYILKTLGALSLPIAALAVWTQNCFSAIKNTGTGPIWSIGPGILVLALIIEVFALYGVTAAWRRSKGSDTVDA